MESSRVSSVGRQAIDSGSDSYISAVKIVYTSSAGSERLELRWATTLPLPMPRTKQHREPRQSRLDCAGKEFAWIQGGQHKAIGSGSNEGTCCMLANTRGVWSPTDAGFPAEGKPLAIRQL